MPFVHQAQASRLDDALFPIAARADFPQHAWHTQYPDGIPAGLEYPPLRAEQLLVAAADRYPDNLAVLYFQTRWTYAELVGHVQQAAANLRRLGIRS